MKRVSNTLWLCILLQTISIGSWAQQPVAEQPAKQKVVTVAQTVAQNKPEAESSAVATVDRLLVDFDALQDYIRHYDAAVGEQRLLLKLKANELLDRQIVLVKQLLEQKSDHPEQISDDELSRLTQMLQQQLHISNLTYQSLIKGREQLRSEYEGADPDQALSLELQMNNKEALINDIMTLKLRLVRWLDAFGVNTSAAQAELKANIDARAKELKLLLNYTNNQIEVLIKARMDASEQEIGRIDLRLRRLALKQKSSVTSLKKMVSMMDSLGLNGDAYKEVLITSTGAVSEDLFEVRVVSRLLQSWTDTLISWFGENAIAMVVKVIVFAVILLVFSLVSNLARKLVAKTVRNSKLDLSQLLQDFFISIVGKVVFFIGVMIALSQLGIQLAPLLAGFGIAGIVIGFALQGTLSNFASGMMILIYRPFDVGDMIIAGGVQGRVKKLSLVNTTIQTIDNRRVVVPNNLIWDGVITNISAETLRRVDLVFGIGYGDDIERAEAVLMEEVLKHKAILQDPAPIVKLANLGESSVDFWVRPWVKNADYWDVHWDLTRAVKLRFDKEGISIPFPQRDVHLYSATKQQAAE